MQLFIFTVLHITLCSVSVSLADTPVASNIWKLLGISKLTSTSAPDTLDVLKKFNEKLAANTKEFNEKHKELDMLKEKNMLEAMAKDKEIEKLKLDNLKETTLKNKELIKAKIDGKLDAKLEKKLDLKKEKLLLKEEKLDKVKLEKEKEKSNITPGYVTTTEEYTEEPEAYYESDRYGDMYHPSEYHPMDSYSLKPVGTYAARPHYSVRPMVPYRPRPIVHSRPVLNRVRYGMGHPVNVYGRRIGCPVCSCPKSRTY